MNDDNIVIFNCNFQPNTTNWYNSLCFKCNRQHVCAWMTKRLTIYRVCLCINIDCQEIRQYPDKLRIKSYKKPGHLFHPFVSHVVG